MGAALTSGPAWADTAPAANTWTLLPLPERTSSPVFALAVDPQDANRVLVGTPSGHLYRSTQGGASWDLVGSGLGRGVLTLAFDPSHQGTVLAGTRGGGIWRSVDGGTSWSRDAGTEGRTVRSFVLGSPLAVAGTDTGVLVSSQGGSWTPAGLNQVAVSAVALPTPSRLLVGGDQTRLNDPLPLYASPDGGHTWQPSTGSAGGSSIVSALAAAPGGTGNQNAPLVMGTNTGLFTSADGGATWKAVAGGGGLPATDYTSVAFAAGNPGHFYVASDGGASPQGGLWSTSNGGGAFTSLKPPVASVTALAASTDSQPALYVATFRPIDQAVMLWEYRDAGGTPQAPVGGVPKPAAGPASPPPAAPATARTPGDWLKAVLQGPEAPYLVLGLLAVVVMLVAGVAYLRRARDL
ncbi:MAG: hypothetical protein J2P45_02275 [Candidatus Dormibacteraeota bacterium]|nr:hypothetical protein [Candidatus Dormibacteraeota bacterium]